MTITYDLINLIHVNSRFKKDISYPIQTLPFISIEYLMISNLHTDLNSMNEKNIVLSSSLINFPEQYNLPFERKNM